MELRHKPQSLEELRSEHKPVRNARQEFKHDLSGLERFAIYVTRRIGSMGFFIFLMLWTIVWLGWNMFSPAKYHFDPAPAFVIWLFVSNILQLILLPLIMVSQNIESRAADKRAAEDFHVNQKAEREVGVILEHLENQHQVLVEVAKKIGV